SILFWPTALLPVAIKQNTTIPMTIPNRPLPKLAALLAMLGGSGALYAQTPEQESDSLYRETYAIVGARVEIGDGRVLDKATVIVRNGKILAVGADVPVPSYA